MSIEAGSFKLDFSKNSIQRDFFECGSRYQLASGGFGSGKSFVCCAKIIILAALMPGSVWMVLRKTYPDLRDSTRKTFAEVMATAAGLDPATTSMKDHPWTQNWSEAKNELIWKNGSMFIFRHFEEGTVKVGSDLTGFFLDQAEEASEKILDALIGRMRRKSPRHYGLLAMNPNGFDWQWRLFVKQDRPDYRAFNFPTEANRHNLPPGYIEGMLEKYPKDWVERYVEGKWSSMSGLIFHEFDDADNMCDPFDLPRQWARARGLDWGVDAPATAVPIFHDAEKDVYYQADEYGDSELTAEEHARNILAAFKPYDPFRASILDASAFNRESDLKSIADQYRKAGLVCLKGTKDQLARVMLVKTLLKQRRLILVRGRTERTVEEVKSWKWGPRKNGREVPAAGNDHFLDAQGYCLYWMAGKQMGEAAPGKKDPEKVERGVGRLSIASSDVKVDPVSGIPILA